MRNFCLVILCVCTTAIYSCKKESQAQLTNKRLATYQTDVVGTWYYQSFDEQYYLGGIDVYDEILNNTQLHDASHYQFNANGTVYYGYVRLTDGSLDPTQNQVFNYNFKNGGGADSLLLTNDDEKVSYVVTSLDANKFSCIKLVPDPGLLVNRTTGAIVTAQSAVIVATLGHTGVTP